MRLVGRDHARRARRASIDMLQIVMRPSIESASIAGAGVLDHVADAARDADLADRAEHHVLRASRRTGARRRSVTRIVFGRAWSSVCVASTCSTSEVPMPKASAPKAPCVEVWLVAADDRHPRLRQARARGRSRARSPRARCRSRSAGRRTRRSSRASASSCAFASGSRIGPGSVGTLWSIVAIVRSGRRTRPAREPQRLERLRARHLVHEVEVDVEQRRLARPLVDDVRRPRSSRRASAPLSAPPVAG